MVQLDPNFGEIANTSIEYQVFLTPNGDCKGLYVTNKTAGSFEVRELGGGVSDIAFDYRIVARRRGMENVRMQDVTEHQKLLHDGTAAGAVPRGAKLPAKPPARPPKAHSLQQNRASLVMPH